MYARRPLGASFNSLYLNQAPKHPLKIMIWGCFSANGVCRIKVIEGSMNSNEYINTLETKMVPSVHHLFPDGQYTFQDDGAPCHRSKIVQEWHCANKTNLLDWPGNSPDINPIENLWAIVKAKVRYKMPTGKKSLLSAIIQCWHHEISPELCMKLVDSLPRPINALISSKGGHTKY